MKKTLLLLSVSALSFANAQSLTVSDTLRIGDKIFYYEAETTASNLDAVVGAGSIWDYSNLALINTDAAVKDSIIPNSNTTDFPDADYQEQFDGGINVFFSNSATEVTSYGFTFELEGNTSTVTYDTDPMKTADFPMGFGTTDYTDVIDGHLKATVDGFGEQTIVVTGTAVIKADGSGTLKLGSTTFTNVLRIKTIEVLDGNVPAILPLFAGGPVNITRTSYAYYHLATSRLPIFLHGKLNSVIPTQPDVEEINVWSSVNLAAYATIEDGEIVKTSIFPNPATDVVTIESINATSINIFNTVGKLVYSKLTPTSIETVNTSNFTTGIYIVEVKNNGIITKEKLIIK